MNTESSFILDLVRATHASTLVLFIILPSSFVSSNEYTLVISNDKRHIIKVVFFTIFYIKYLNVKTSKH